jgi:hypothetical protein
LRLVVALGQGRPWSLAGLVRLVRGRRRERRAAALLALRKMGPRAAPAASAVVRAVGSEDPAERCLALMCLQTMGAKAAPALVAALRSRERAAQIGLDWLAEGCRRAETARRVLRPVLGRNKPHEWRNAAAKYLHAAAAPESSDPEHRDETAGEFPPDRRFTPHSP